MTNQENANSQQSKIKTEGAGRPEESSPNPAKPAADTKGSAGQSQLGSTGLRMAPAKDARMKRRHHLVVWSFVLFVVVPISASVWYLYERAVDQYASYVAFSVRSEDVASSMDLLSGLTAFGSTGAKDSDILFEFVRNRDVVENIDKKLDIRSMFSRHYEQDPIFGFKNTGTIEDLLWYWGRMVSTDYDRSTGLIEIRVNAFDPVDAQNIVRELLDQGTELVNNLSLIAREDATRYARQELDRSVKRLRVARQTITQFRSDNQLIDPTIEIGIQTGLISALHNHLSEAMVDYNLLSETLSEGDPRLVQLQQRIDVIRYSIDEEKQKFSTGDTGGRNFSSLMGEYEGLMVDREFAEQAYVSALATFDIAQIEAQRKSRYLAAYLQPTIAESSEYPNKPIIILVISSFLVFLWGVFVMVYYAIRDRR